MYKLLVSFRCFSLSCCNGYHFMKQCSPSLIRTEPRGHEEKKRLKKICCNQHDYNKLIWCNHLSLLLWLSFHEALQSYFTDIPALHSIVYYTILYYVVLLCFDWPLIHHSEIKCTCDYVRALDSSRCCSLACSCSYLFMKHSSPALIRTELRGHAEKKKSNKTCSNQNMPALLLSDDL